MRITPVFCVLALALAGCSDVGDDQKAEGRSLSAYVNADPAPAAGAPTGLGRLARRWDCADIKQTFRPNAETATVEIAFEYLDGSSGTETASYTRTDDLVAIELQLAEEVTLYTYDISRDTMAWRDINGDSHVCAPA